MSSDSNAALAEPELSAEEAQQEIVDEFAMFDDWTERYRYIIDLGRDLDQLAEDRRSDDKLIRGCQSRVWLDYREGDGRIAFSAATDAAIVAGLIALVLRVYNNRQPAEISRTEPWFVREIGLQEHLSPTRSNGLHAMLGKIKSIAEAAA